MNHIINHKSEQGFVLVTALLIMLILTLIGLISTSNTTTELEIAGNDKVNKKTFYEAEAGALLGIEVVEQSLNCVTGFKETDPTHGYADLTSTDFATDIRVNKQDSEYVLWNNIIPSTTDIFDDSKADALYPIPNLTDGIEVGYLYFGGETSVLAGGALQMAAGYEGKGKSAAQGGVAKNFDIYSRFEGLINSESIILLGWQHIVGVPEGNIYGWCN